MMDSIPKIIYDGNGNKLRVIKATVIYFKDLQKRGYVFHIEGEERITSVSEYELTYENGHYVIKRPMFKESIEM